MRIISFIILIALFVIQVSQAGLIKKRCIKYEHLVRQYHFFYFGVNFPYWYSLAQIEVESACIHNRWSFDEARSYGLAQITWKIWKNKLRRAGIPEIYSVRNNLKAQAYINYLAWRTLNKRLEWCKRLWVMYQIYNGGSLVIKEIRRAGECCWCSAYRNCRRRDICWKWRGKIHCKNACDINYEYSLKIYNKGQKYRKGKDERPFIFW